MENLTLVTLNPSLAAASTTTTVDGNLASGHFAYLPPGITEDEEKSGKKRKRATYLTGANAPSVVLYRVDEKTRRSTVEKS
jgi:hypothetical protein